MPHTLVHVPHLGKRVVLVDREKMRRKNPAHTLKCPSGLGLIQALPASADVRDWSKGRLIKFPIEGNDQYGDCYYAAMCHAVQTFTGNIGTPAVFDVSAVVHRYLQISGGDNGLSDGDVYPEWKAGIIGPNGPHKIYADAVISPKDHATIRTAIDLVGGVCFTASLGADWVNKAAPGVIWDRTNPNPSYGHAMWYTGYVKAGQPFPFKVGQFAAGQSSPANFYFLETWGFAEPVLITEAGLESADPEIIAAVSPEWFKTDGYAPNGYHYTELARYWLALGGPALPPSPFPAPGPGPNPGPSPNPVPDPTTMALKNFGISFGVTSPWSNGMNVGSVCSGTFSMKITGLGQSASLQPSNIGVGNAEGNTLGSFKAADFTELQPQIIGFSSPEPAGSFKGTGPQTVSIFQLWAFITHYWPLLEPYIMQYGPTIYRVVREDLAAGKAYPQIIIDVAEALAAAGASIKH